MSINLHATFYDKNLVPFLYKTKTTTMETLTKDYTTFIKDMDWLCKTYTQFKEPTFMFTRFEIETEPEGEETEPEQKGYDGMLTQTIMTPPRRSVTPVSGTSPGPGESTVKKYKLN